MLSVLCSHVIAHTREELKLKSSLAHDDVDYVVHIEEGSKRTAVVLSCFPEEQKQDPGGKQLNWQGSGRTKTERTAGIRHSPRGTSLPDRLQDWVDPSRGEAPPPFL